MSACQSAFQCQMFTRPSAWPMQNEGRLVAPLTGNWIAAASRKSCAANADTSWVASAHSRRKKIRSPSLRARTVTARMLPPPCGVATFWALSGISTGSAPSHTRATGSSSGTSPSASLATRVTAGELARRRSSWVSTPARTKTPASRASPARRGLRRTIGLTSRGWTGDLRLRLRNPRNDADLRLHAELGRILRHETPGQPGDVDVEAGAVKGGQLLAVRRQPAPQVLLQEAGLGAAADRRVGAFPPRPRPRPLPSPHLHQLPLPPHFF